MSNLIQLSIGTSGSITDGYAVQFVNGLASAAIPTSYTPFHGIALQTTTTGQSNLIQTHGPLSPHIAYLGDGYACAVGLNANGQPVRSIDGSCVTAPNWIGYCDGYGTIFVQPKLADNFNALDFGAIGDNSTDNAGPIAAMVTRIKTLGGRTTLYFPSGTYLTSQPLIFDATSSSASWASITLSGTGGIADLDPNIKPASVLVYTGTGAGIFISCRSTNGITIKDIAVLYNNSGFTGTLVSFDHAAIGSPFDSSDIQLLHSTFGCVSGISHTASALISLDSLEDALIDGCRFSNAACGIRGVDAAGLGFSIRVKISACFFIDLTTAPIMNAGENWEVSSCTFEATARAYYDSRTAQTTYGLQWFNNWMGDSDSSDTIAWVDPGTNYFQAAVFFGNTFDVGTATKPSIRLGSSGGIAIFGNPSMGPIDFTPPGGPYANCKDISVFNNALSTIAPFTNLANTNTGVSIWNNYGDIYQNNYDQHTVAGHLITLPPLDAAPITTSATGSSVSLRGNNFQGSNDTSGQITLAVATTLSIGDIITLTFTIPFDVSYGFAPNILLTPGNAAAAVLTGIYVDSASSNGTQFVVASTASITPGTYICNYFVIQ